MDLSIITVTWNTRDLVRENFKAIYENTQNISFEIFAIDNNSQDGTAEMITKEFPQVKLVANNYNAGFSKANNQGIRQATGRYILLLNPDMRVLSGTLENMVKWMDSRPDVGLAGCHLINGNGETVPHVRRFPKLLDQMAIVLKLPHLFPKILDKYLYSDFDYSKEAEVDSIRGSFFMFRNQGFFVGGIQEFPLQKISDMPKFLDERYFIWFEEVDFCKQVKSSGWKIMYTPAAECIDYIGKSFAQVTLGRTQNYMRESMIKYFKKWHPGWQAFLIQAAWPIGRTIAIVGSSFGFKRRAKT